MSLFDGMSNVRKPDVIMNDGPLPGSSPPFFPAAQINYSSDLLGDISPYDYGKPTNLSDQTSYLNIPHKIAKIVPQLNLPNANSEGSFPLSHAVDVGDIGFVLRIDRRGSVVTNLAAFERLKLTRMIDPMVNIVTVNYILAGLQRFWNNRDAFNWQQLMVDLRFVEDAYAERGAFNVGDAIRFITEIARPWGIPHTSELQGGQHEGGASPITFPVNFISSFNVSGLTRNICNIWSQHNLSAGDDLILKLEKLPFAARDGGIKYHLNHWKKSVSIQQFRYEDGGVNEGWQLVPSVLSTYTPSRVYENYDYREHGYWHLLRTQVMSRCESSDDRRYEASNAGIYHDDRAVMRGALLEGTFEPTWIEYTRWMPRRGVRRPREEAEERFFQAFAAGRPLAAAAAVPPRVVFPQFLLGANAEAAVQQQHQDIQPVHLAAAVAPPPLLEAAAASAGEITFVPPKKPRRLLGMAQTQAGLPVVVETVKPV